MRFLRSNKFRHRVKDPELPSVQYKMTNELGNVQATAFLESGTLRFKGDRSSAVDVFVLRHILNFPHGRRYEECLEPST